MAQRTVDTEALTCDPDSDHSMEPQLWGQDTVSSAAERALKQTQLEDRKQQLLKTISDSETGLRKLQEEAQTISHSAQDAVLCSGDTFTQIILLLENRRSEVEQQIKDQEKSELQRVQELQEQVLLDITQMKTTLFEIDALLKTPDHNLYSNMPTHEHIVALDPAPSEEVRYFDSVTTELSYLKKSLQVTLTQSEIDMSFALRQVRTVLFCREHFLKYACDITLDPNTAHQRLRLSEGNRRVTKMRQLDSYPHHRDRFIDQCVQVLSSEALTGRCYWEVEWRRIKWVSLAVAYRDIDKSVLFGNNDQSWSLQWWSGEYSFRFNNITSVIPGPHSFTLGVFLDHSAGLLSFYSVNDQTLTLIHTVQASFTQPLHVGVGIRRYDDTLYFPQIKNCD